MAERSLDDQIEDVLAEITEIGAQAEEELATTRGTDLVPAANTAEVSRAQMMAARVATERAKAEIDEKREELDRLVRAKKREIERMQSEANALLGPLNKTLEVLKEGIWTVNLYLGTQEEIKVVQDGPPAPADTPITVRQMVLYMDEEARVFGKDNQGITGDTIRWFDEWIVEKPEHLQTILPEPRGVVALKPRRFTRHDGYEKQDHETYWLIRNGERLYRLRTDFEVGANLIPRANEWTRLFTDRKGQPLTPGSHQWEEAQEKAQKTERHYMRVALILQGLADRTTVFMPMPDHWRDGGLFLDKTHHEREHVRFLMDADNAIGTGAEPFKAWQKRTNAELRVGMRIIGAFRRNAGFDRFDLKDYGRGNSRLHPETAEKPQDGMIYTVEDRQGDYYVIRYERTDEVFDPTMWREDPTKPGWGWQGGRRTAKVRASCKLRPDDTFFVVFDEIDIDKANSWLHSRADRHNYEQMIPVLKAAIEGKEYEWVAETPLRAMVASLLVRENGVEPAEGESEAPELIDWAKRKNRIHRTLVAGESPYLAVNPDTGNAEGAKIVQQIVREHARRVKDRKRVVPDRHWDFLHRHHPEALVIARNAAGRYVILEPMNEQNVFVKVTERGSRTLDVKDEKPWRLPGARLSATTILMVTDRWKAWDHQATLGQYLTGDEIKECAARLLGQYRCGPDLKGVLDLEPHEPEELDDEEAELDGQVASVLYDPEHRAFSVYTYGSDADVNPLKVLTGTQKDVEMRRWYHGWRRTIGQAIDLEPKPRHAREVTWPRDAWHGEKQQAPAWASKRALFRDETILQRAAKEHARFKQVTAKKDELEKLEEKALNSVRAQWEKAEWTKLFGVFMTEYGDSSLWEGHKKTLSIDHFPYRHDSWAKKATFPKLLQRLIERGVRLDGITVTRAAEIGRQHGIDFQVPTDIASMKITARTDAPTAEVEDDVWGINIMTGEKIKLTPEQQKESNERAKVSFSRDAQQEDAVDPDEEEDDDDTYDTWIEEDDPDDTPD